MTRPPPIPRKAFDNSSRKWRLWGRNQRNMDELIKVPINTVTSLVFNPRAYPRNQIARTPPPFDTFWLTPALFFAHPASYSTGSTCAGGRGHQEKPRVESLPGWTHAAHLHVHESASGGRTQHNISAKPESWLGRYFYVSVLYTLAYFLAPRVTMPHFRCCLLSTHLASHVACVSRPPRTPHALSDSGTDGTLPIGPRLSALAARWTPGREIGTWTGK